MSNMVVGKGIKNAKQIVSKILAHPVLFTSRYINCVLSYLIADVNIRENNTFRRRTIQHRLQNY
jgi:hypothetical protein